MVFLDESAVDERSLERRFSCAPRGQRAVAEKYFKRRTKRWSLVLSIDINGYLLYLLTRESITKERFNEFVIKEILLIMNLFLQEHLILCIDNTKIYYSLVRLSLIFYKLLTLIRNYKLHATSREYSLNISLLIPLI